MAMCVYEIAEYTKYKPDELRSPLHTSMAHPLSMLLDENYKFTTAHSQHISVDTESTECWLPTQHNDGGLYNLKQKSF